MAGFLRGVLTGALAGTIFALATSAKTGKQHQADLKNWVSGTKADVDHLQRASANFKNAAARLQETIPTNLEPALDGINTAVEHFKFKSAPHVAKIQESLAHISAAMPEDLAATKTTTPAPDAPAVGPDSESETAAK
ncbi:YtxH domain-containing protein [Lacticaseibacillus hulanensis]|uniref:YtxH domain-containing protein n=1 Tax=Lacticaseibacillus hulanensis TaxID=2493111 RepID=UPI000FD7A58C|nr:hypothetical protein [Lacticaseibacillus hulanensis]